MPLTLIIFTVGWMPIYKNRLALSRSVVDRMWSGISTEICSKSTGRFGRVWGRQRTASLST